MSRAIRLTKIHALNWYGYSDSLETNGHLLLAGVTGSGKSILMDLIQLVLVGTDRALFNRSATGTTSDRTLKSYILCDTKREENGQPQYVRDKGAICYVALEFTWPDGERVETWGLRIEYRNTVENQGRVLPFFCAGALNKSDFLDPARRPLEQAAFRHFIEKQRDGHTFETQEQYLRDMAGHSHLNFNRSVLSSLLPTAMSFTNLKSFDEFCRRFILPGDRLNVADVVASYRNFQAYERDLRELRDQYERLSSICQFHAQYTAAERDRTLARWLSAEAEQESAQARMNECQKRLARLREDRAQETARIAELDERIHKRAEELKQLQALIAQSSEGQLYLFLKSRNADLARDIERLRGIGERVDTALRQRIRNAQTWLAETQAAPLDEPADSNAFASAVKRLESCRAEDSETCLTLVAAEAEQLKIGLSRGIRAVREQLDAVRAEMAELRDEIAALQLGHLPFPTKVLNAINNELPGNGREPAAQPLCKLCEVIDEHWRPAVEVAFTRKFAIAVSPAHYERALAIYLDLEADSPLESLINPSKAKARPVLPGSLAEKIEASTPEAQAIISQLFGDLMCVEKRADLARHERAILPDGFLVNGAFAERPRHYDNLPFVGQSGLRKQLEVKRSRLQSLEAEERQARPRVEEVDRINHRAGELIPAHTSLTRDLVEARQLFKLDAELQENLAKLQTIDSASFEENERQLASKELEQQAWQKELRLLVGSQKRGEIEAIELALAGLNATAEQATRLFDRIKADSGDISIHAARLKELKELVALEALTPEAAARRFTNLEADAREQAATNKVGLEAARRELAMAYRKFEDLVPENPSNEPWAKLHRQIAEANIPDYQAKSQTARKQWENLFRTNVLSKLDRALREVRDLVYLLNSQMKSPIGNDRYEIQAKPSPDFKTYRDLISLNCQCQQDDLFFASVDGEMKAALEHFLTTLVEEPDSIEAARLLDYRHYFDYDLLVWDERDAQAKSVSVDRQSGKFSGGENQSPYFVAILASYLRAYNRHETRWRDPSLALVPIDEAFSKLSPERIEDCVRALQQLDLQGVLSMSAGNIPFAFSQCDQLIIVSKHEERNGARSLIRNVPVSIRRDSEAGRKWMQEHA
jgi:hypothetical protein